MGEYAVFLESLQVDQVPVQPWRRKCVVISKNKEILVNGYDPKASIVYQFYGCKWHSCPYLESANDKYQKTLSMENQI